MNEQIAKLAEQAGGEFWQRIESDGVLNKKAYITFDPPQSLEKFAELIVQECMEQVWYTREEMIDETISRNIRARMAKHFGVE